MKQKNLMDILLLIFIASFSSISIAQTSDYDSEKEAAERIKRQLELANQLRNERLKKEREKSRRQEHETKLQEHCFKVRDELNRLNEGRRRWYQLDKSGERVYLTEAQVTKNREALQKKFDSQCTDYK